MTDLRLYIAVGLPVIAVLASMVVGLVQIADMRAMRGEVNTKTDLLTGKVYEMMAKH